MHATNVRTRQLRVLVVDDEVNIRITLGLCLEAAGHVVLSCANAQEVLQQLTGNSFDIIFLDVRLGLSDGLDLIPHILAENPLAKVIVITAYASAETAMIAMDRGAADYLPKPFTPAQVQLVIRKVLEQRQLELKLGSLQPAEHWAAALDEPVTTSSEMRQALDLARRLAGSDATLLIRGEPGVGKEWLARAIHRWSARSAGACAAISCRTVAPDALDATLFGRHVRGGAPVPSAPGGLAAMCDGGTLILKEIGAAPLTLQPKLVRLLREKEYERQDDFALRRSDVRVIATTSEDLERAAARENLRADLLLAVNIVQIELPPLRQRAQDIRLLAERFCALATHTAHRAAGAFTPEAMDLLLSYAWPGNVAELRDTVAKAVQSRKDGPIALEHLPRHMLCRDRDEAQDLLPLDALEEMHIRRVLQTAKSLDAAAAILGVNPATLWRRRKHYGLE